MKDRTKNRIAALVLLLYSVVTRFFTSIYSIRFDKNVMQSDGTCFYLIGKAIMQGKVLYKDIFDHKTPYIYFINGIASLIDYNHIGLFIIEVVILFVSLYYTYKILRLVFENTRFDNYTLSVDQCRAISLIGAFITGIILCNNDIIDGYYRTEAFVIASVLPSIYILAKYYYGKTKLIEMSKLMFIIGILAGFSFMINIKGGALFVPLIIPLTYDCIKQKEWIELLKIFCLGFLGVVIAIMPYVIYMLVTDSTKDMIFALWDTNLAYSRDYMEYGLGMTTTTISTKDSFIYLIIAFFIEVPILMLLIFLSLLIVFLTKYNYKFKIVLCCEFLVAFIVTLLVGRPHIYYLYTLLPYIIIIFVFIIKLFLYNIKKYVHINIRLSSIVSIILSFIILLGINCIINNNIVCVIANKKLKDAMELQSVAKQYDSNYSRLKVLGLAYIPDIYLWLDTDINYKYFVRPFITYNSFKAAFNEQTNYINNVDPDIIVIRNFEFVPKQLEMQIKFILNYYYDLIGETEEYYLYGKKRQ